MLFGMMVAGLMMLGSCGGKQQQSGGGENNTSSQGEFMPLDRTIYGLCGEGTAMNTLELLTDKKTEATEVINLNTLLGDWVMPDPIDGSSEIGIRIKEGGVAESIEMTNIIYRTWKIVNGKLEIISIREGGGDQEETNLYDILSLGADTLCYKTIGKPRDEEETFEYNRFKEKPKVDLRGLQLEDTQDEFNKI